MLLRPSPPAKIPFPLMVNGSLSRRTGEPPVPPRKTGTPPVPPDLTRLPPDVRFFPPAVTGLPPLPPTVS